MLPLDIYQTGYVVNDLDAAVARWRSTTGLDGFQHIHHVEVENGLYRGRPTRIDFSVAVVQTATMNIEFITQHDEVPSCYRDVFPKGKEGLHHVAVRSGHFEMDLARYLALGFESAFCGVYRGTRFNYIDTAASLGIMVELVEANRRAN